MNFPSLPYSRVDQDELQQLALELDALAKHVRLYGLFGHRREPMACVDERLVMVIRKLGVYLPRPGDYPNSANIFRRIVQTMPRDELAFMLEEKDRELKQLRRQVRDEHASDVPVSEQVQAPT